MEAVRQIDNELKLFCQDNSEVAGFWSRFSSGAHFQGGQPPARIQNDAEKVNVWHKCQTRRWHIAEVVKQFSD
jgi:hypothetical protein